uniref:HTH CENPB-type domain-containing protein n=1 Tax=Pygocentrus nattereri TaxID=42514 RepID=A0AAR2LC38_PYGNA
MPSKRKSYSADYKLQVVKYAAENGNRAAERKFGVTEKLVRDWRKAEVSLTAMKKTKKANRGLKARWPQLEERVRTWVLEQRAAGRGLSTVQLRLHAQVVAKEMNINDFAGGPSWCYRFMQRNRFSIRARTTMSQKLPADVQAKVDSFREFVEKHVTEHNVTLDHIINMDEVPLTFDIPMGRNSFVDSDSTDSSFEKKKKKRREKIKGKKEKMKRKKEKKGPIFQRGICINLH